MQINQKPYNLLLLTGLTLLLISFLVSFQNGTVDIHLHDTYFIVSHTHVFWILALSALLVWTVYLLTANRLYSKTLTWIHVIATILTLSLGALTLYSGGSLLSSNPRGYYDYSPWMALEACKNSSQRTAIITAMVLIGQLSFIVNVIAGLFKRRP